MCRFVALLVLPTALVAADTTSVSLVELIRSDLHHAVRTIADEPLPSLAASAGATAAVLWMSGADQSLRTAALRNRSAALDAVARFGNFAGEAWTAVGLSAVLGIGGALTGSEHTATTGRQLLEALAISGTVTTMVKIALGRARPFRNRGDGHLLPFRWDDSQWSFPSGHATATGTIAGVVFARTENVWYRTAVAATLLATMVARVYSDKHWASDVVAGAAIGASVGYALARSDVNKRAAVLYPTSAGIGVVMRW